MCTALVVRDEYWKQQLDICAQLSGVKIDRKQIDRLMVVMIDYATVIGKYLAHLIDVAIEAFNEMTIIIKDSVQTTIEALSELFKQCELSGTDDFDTVCDKLENRMVYLNRQNCIRQEQYYKAQFKLVKVNYNIMNHDRRC